MAEMQTLHAAFAARIDAVLDALEMEGSLPADAARGNVTVEPPRDPSHGDLATNAAMVLAKQAKSNPRALAEKIVEHLQRDPAIAEAEIAGPGFINLRLESDVWRREIQAIASLGADYGRSDMGKGLTVNVEYVSANPTGPMHMGHCRGAVVGDALCGLLEWAGYRVTREYYVNDAGGQVDVLARSAHLRYREALGEEIGDIPEGLYPGDYLKPVGERLAQEFGPAYRDGDESEWLALFRQRSVAAMMEMIREDLSLLGIHHDLFSSEAELQAAKKPEAAEAWLREHGFVYDGVLEAPKGKAPKSGVSGQEIYRRILAIDRESDKRFTIHSDRVTFDYQAMSLQLLPEHLERQIFEADPARYRFRTRFETEPTNPGLHYGPYRISAVHRGSHIVLKPNPNWWGVPPAYAEIILRVIPKTAALEANFLSGSVDYIAGELGLTLNQALAFEKRYPDQYHYVYKPGLIYEHIDFNLNNPILAERKVRHALAHGIDRKAISLQLFGGKHPVANSNVSPLDWIHETDVARYQYNPAKAKALLVDAGWGTLRGGVRYNARGEKLSLELMTTAGNRTRELVEQVLQSQWRQIGVDITIRNEPARVFFGETVTKRKFPAMAMFAWVDEIGISDWSTMSLNNSKPNTDWTREKTPTHWAVCGVAVRTPNELYRPVPSRASFATIRVKR